MQKTLRELYLDCVQAIDNIAPDFFIATLSQSIEKVFQFVEKTPGAVYGDVTFRKIFAKEGWLTDSQTLQEFFQLVGEIQFWMLADERGVKLARIAEEAHPTPDFQMVKLAKDSPQFEVKTLSVTGGWRALQKMSEDSLNSQIELEKQVSRGVQLAMQVHVIAPHGDIPLGLQQTTICRNLIDKSRNNIKLGQYAAAPTFLVLSLMLIDGHHTGNADLRPVAHGYPCDWSVRTGAMWTLAFGSIGQFVHAIPAYEGLPGIEGQLERQGILVDSNYESIAGMLLVVHRLSEEPILFGLRRHGDQESWDSTYPEIGRAFCGLVGTNWNDDLDTNGWQLTDH